MLVNGTSPLRGSSRRRLRGDTELTSESLPPKGQRDFITHGPSAMTKWLLSAGGKRRSSTRRSPRARKVSPKNYLRIVLKSSLRMLVILTASMKWIRRRRKHECGNCRRRCSKIAGTVSRRISRPTTSRRPLWSWGRN